MFQSLFGKQLTKLRTQTFYFAHLKSKNLICFGSLNYFEIYHLGSNSFFAFKQVKFENGFTDHKEKLLTLSQF